MGVVCHGICGVAVARGGKALVHQRAGAIFRLYPHAEPVGRGRRCAIRERGVKDEIARGRGETQFDVRLFRRNATPAAAVSAASTVNTVLHGEPAVLVSGSTSDGSSTKANSKPTSSLYMAR